MTVNELIDQYEELLSKGYKPNTILVEVDNNGMVIQQRGPKTPQIHIDELKEILK